MLFDSSTLQSYMHNIDRSEIRTRATELTGALNERLRPFGHPAYDTPTVKFVECNVLSSL